MNSKGPRIVGGIGKSLRCRYNQQATLGYVGSSPPLSTAQLGFVGYY